MYEADEYPIETAIDNTESKLTAVIRKLMPQAMNNELVIIIEDDPDMQEQLRSEIGVYFRILLSF